MSTDENRENTNEVPLAEPSEPDVMAGLAFLSHLREDLCDVAKSEIDRGIFDHDSFKENVPAIFQNLYLEDWPETERSLLVAIAAVAIDQAEAAAEQEQADWPETVDNDRLDAVFAELNANGIIAHQDFACCTSCATGHLHDEMGSRAADDLMVRGFAYYHAQDTDHAIEGEGLWIGYGALSCDIESELDVPNTIIRVLRKHGFAPEWDGSFDTRIFVPSFIWQCRYRRDEPAGDGDLATDG